ncbi:MAG: carbohydrate ABC transporter permease [Actinobacteria bacterium]|nr:carbohydrate ABC transporter permease [Rubrobacter sp.]MBA3629205.1 carbohydrate ABC transporter permease [Actinomycetota bacterium]MDQ3533305.1 carbohydrate ABC transporter permease [Actinomycetota bacterium]
MGKSFENPWMRVAFYAAMVLFVLMTLFPLYWVFKMSLVTPEELFKTPPSLLPTNLDIAPAPYFFTAYETIFADPDFKAAIVNSIVVAGITTVICLTVGSVCAYALARINFVFRTPIQAFILAISFFPAVAIIAPLFLQFQAFGIIGTYWAMIIPDILFALPLTVFLLLAYFRELPAGLEEAAKVDGANIWQAFFRITIPLSAPGVVTTAILTFIFAWNEFLFANTFALDITTQPATVVIPQFATTYTTDYGAQAAASIVVTLPLVALVLIFQRRIVSGLTAGAVK